MSFGWREVRDRRFNGVDTVLKQCLFFSDQKVTAREANAKRRREGVEAEIYEKMAGRSPFPAMPKTSAATA